MPLAVKRLWQITLAALGPFAAAIPAKAEEPDPQFGATIHPLLVKYCEDCHSPQDPDASPPFLSARAVDDIQRARADWKSIVPYAV